MGSGKAKQELKMPLAAADKQPLKCNVYEFARNLVSTLTPMFPYMDEGAMVPTIGVFYGEPEGDYGYFEHVNTVDEVAIIFGAGETNARARAGLVRWSARSHGVGNFLTDPDSPDSFSVVTVTQRQSTGGGQNEAVAFTCAECSTELFRQEYDATPPARGAQRNELGPVGHLHTIIGSANAADAFNGDEKNRTCSKCGHLNKPFPLHRWGWHRYRDQTHIIREAFESLRETAG